LPETSGRIFSWVVLKSMTTHVLIYWLFFKLGHSARLKNFQLEVETFVQRFSIEILFEEARAHLGLETQRQWSDLAIARSTPLIFALFSLITLIALELYQQHNIPVRNSTWYEKKENEATFSDVIAHVRRHCWQEKYRTKTSKTKQTIQLSKKEWDFLLDRIASSA